ncbi:hypothetical protein FOXB_13709 [Fusarium oxysporum f. sp. conglutinans Fo5176]|uniref:Uncharacterized protein n=1 Tax=Fusarium oxysporum (strain Fo5176) TaxID=660025 RepID=F9G4X7_FUSOF|nr:hypothetical protein FOXB_13709 [Fusarium oxysporum f. sp. conglutinans Fo5176]
MPGSVPDSLTLAPLEIYCSPTETAGNLKQIASGAVTKPYTSLPVEIVPPPKNNPKPAWNLLSPSVQRPIFSDFGDSPKSYLKFTPCREQEPNSTGSALYRCITFLPRPLIHLRSLNHAIIAGSSFSSIRLPSLSSFSFAELT